MDERRVFLDALEVNELADAEYDAMKGVEEVCGCWSRDVLATRDEDRS